MAWIHLHGDDRTTCPGSKRSACIQSCTDVNNKCLKTEKVCKHIPQLTTYKPLRPLRWQNQQPCRAYAHHWQPQQRQPGSSSAAHKGVQTKGGEGADVYRVGNK